MTDKDIKRNRYYWLKWHGGNWTSKGVDDIVWVDNNMVFESDGTAFNREMFLDGEEEFIEVGMDCPYNQLMRKCRFQRTVFSCWGVDFITEEQVN